MRRLRKKQLCSMTGITSATLRYYVDQGIVSPIREENGSYYSYSLGDAAIILQTRQMRGFGTPMEKIAEYVARGSKGRKEYTDVLKEEMTYLACQKIEIEEKMQFLSMLIEARVNPEAREAPFLFHAPSNYYAAFYDGSENTMESVSRLQNNMPHSFISFRLKKGRDPEIGLMIEESRFKETDENVRQHVLKLGSERILAYRAYDDINGLCYEDFVPVLEFCEQHQLHVTSDIFCIALRLFEKANKIGCEVLGGVTFDFG